jgi:hypothetical protein
MTSYQSVRQQIELLTPTEQLHLLQEIAAMLLRNSATRQLAPNADFPLTGTVLQYDDPFEPAVSSHDWDAMS